MYRFLGQVVRVFNEKHCKRSLHYNCFIYIKRLVQGGIFVTINSEYTTGSFMVGCILL